MPWLPLYASEEDLTGIFEFLSTESDVAFLIADGAGRWKAINAMDFGGDRRYCLWHVASGALPLPGVGETGAGETDAETVADPWTGWQEIRPGADGTNPYFGAGHPGIFWLNARSQSPSKNEAIGLSSYEWIGNHYRMIGNAAEPVSEKYWARLGRRVRKGAKKDSALGIY
ncbi:MAG: hypothetical protein ACI9R3_004914 [Verrucomicrobiales bacterium]|jgi:hypothetical protein